MEFSTPWVCPDYICDSKTIYSVSVSVFWGEINLETISECKCNRKSVDLLLHSRKFGPLTQFHSTLLNLIPKTNKSVSAKKKRNSKNI